MKNYQYLCLLFFIFFGVIGCHTTKNVLKFKDKDVIFSIKKGSCRGFCKVYNLKVHKNRYAVYEGLVNVDKYGIYSKRISDQEFLSLQRAFDSVQFAKLDNYYSTEIADLPSIHLTYRVNAIQKTVIGNYNLPESFIYLQGILEDIAESGVWDMVKTYDIQSTNDVTLDRLPKDGEYILNQVIIEIKPNATLTNLLKKYEQYDFQIIKRLSPKSQIWLASFDMNTVSSNDFLVMLKNDPSIKSAELNKIVSPR